jgi:hypothetical protein
MDLGRAGFEPGSARGVRGLYSEDVEMRGRMKLLAIPFEVIPEKHTFSERDSATNPRLRADSQAGMLPTRWRNRAHGI